MEPKDRASMDQVGAAVRDVIPPVLWGLYRGCVEAGFTEAQALELVKSYLVTMVTLQK